MFNIIKVAVIWELIKRAHVAIVAIGIATVVYSYAYKQDAAAIGQGGTAAVQTVLSTGAAEGRDIWQTIQDCGTGTIESTVQDVLNNGEGFAARCAPAITDAGKSSVARLRSMASSLVGTIDHTLPQSNVANCANSINGGTIRDCMQIIPAPRRQPQAYQGSYQVNTPRYNGRAAPILQPTVLLATPQ